MKLKTFVSILLVILATTSFVQADDHDEDHKVAHTHIGINPTWRPDGDPTTADDTQLWFFSVPSAHPIAPTPGWPQWGMDPTNPSEPFLKLYKVKDIHGNYRTKPGDSSKYLWKCWFMYSKDGGYGDEEGFRHLDGWHSAHPDHGQWNLESIDEKTTPAWDIYLKRETASVAEDDFVMLSPSDVPLLQTNGSVYQLQKEWLGEKNAWGIHEHMTFNFWLTDTVGQEVSATLSAYDAGGLYSASDPYTFTFVTVPEPASLLILLGGAAFIGNKRK